MHLIKAYKTKETCADVFPLSVKREWMDQTHAAHAYHCFPVSLTNQLGWGMSFPEDITFIWDGISDSDPSHVKILSGEKYVSPSRANATVSFNTGVMFQTEDNITLLASPVPNYLRDGIVSLSTLITTSFYDGDFPVAWRITRPNVEITIKANTPFISILPIDLDSLNNSQIIFKDFKDANPSKVDMSNYSTLATEINMQGKWTDWYRNAVNHLNEKRGNHQVKKINLEVK
jgi:hypothetical protein